jgi:transposase
LAALYSGLGRPLIAPEMLLRAMLLQAFYSVRLERQLDTSKNLVFCAG